MRQVTLHIGRHKSGTTAIQRFLKQNRDLLADLGFYYPSTGIRGPAHHLISEPMQIRAVKIFSPISPSSTLIMRSLRDEIKSVPNKKIILSSEAFQNCRPNFVRRAFKAYDTRVVVYIRNQLDYLASAYAQKVHATDYTGSLEDYLNNIYSVDYFGFLNRWQEKFPERLTVRKFSRSALEQRDVVTDFLVHGLGVDPANIPPIKYSGDANPSLNSKILQLKLFLNREGYCNKTSQKHLYPLLPQLNEQFGGGKVRVSRSVKKQLIHNCSKTDSAVAAKYFSSDQLFDYSTYQTKEVNPLDEKERSHMIAAINEKLAPAGKTLDMLKNA